VREKAACDSDDAEQGCLPDSLLRAGAREGERGKDLGKVASACFHLLDRLLSLIPSWRLRLEICLFPLSTSCSCRQHGIRGVDVDSIVHISVGPQSEKGPAETCVCVCVTLGRSSFGEEFLTFQPTTVVPTSDPVTNTGLDWTGLEIWKSPFSDLNPMAGMRLSMTLASSPQPAARWELGLPVRMSRGCGSPFAVLRLDLL
jgi:hypothetical protein